MICTLCRNFARLRVVTTVSMDVHASENDCIAFLDSVLPEGRKEGARKCDWMALRSYVRELQSEMNALKADLEEVVS